MPELKPRAAVLVLASQLISFTAAAVSTGVGVVR
jgi:hypothetical protein